MTYCKRLTADDVLLDDHAIDQGNHTIRDLHFGRDHVMLWMQYHTKLLLLVFPSLISAIQELLSGTDQQQLRRRDTSISI